MGKEKYSFSNEMKQKAQKRAELFNPKEKKNVHHICPKSLSKKYDLPSSKVTIDLNAIALEIDFHDWLHGKKFTKEELIKILGNELNELNKELDEGREIKDNEIEWEGLDEGDFIFLAQAILGLTDDDFNENKKATIRIRKNKRKKRR